MLIIWACFVLFSATAMSGSRADNQRNVCPGEEIALECPPRGSAITSGDYDELSWDVAEPSDRSGITSTDIGYCGEWDCTRYNNIGAFKKRITVRDPSQGTLSVTQLIKNDLLTYTCKVQLKQDKDPLVYRVNVSSSVNCLSAHVGQDLILNQALGAVSSKENIQDIWWYRIQQDGKKELLYCNSTSCGKFTDCYSSCPGYLTRLSTTGTSLVLKNVGQNDHGLEFQRRIEPNMKRMAAKPMPRIETVKIKVVLDLNTTNPRKPVTATKGSTVPSQGTKPSAGERIVAFTVLISLFNCLLIFTAII